MRSIWLTNKRLGFADLVDITATKAEEYVTPKQSIPRIAPVERNAAAAKEANIVVLQRNEIPVLYHFTDEANLSSIREHGLLSASSLLANDMRAVMNSTDLSRNLDKSLGLENYVRLSFNSENPMKYVAKNERRISRAVMLRVKLEVVSRPGVLFSDCNATRKDSTHSPSPVCSSLRRCESCKPFRCRS